MTAELPVSFVFTEDHWQDYAAALLREPDPFKAALIVFNKDDNVNKALWISSRWPEDPKIKAIQARLKADNGIKDFLPTKEDALQKLWDMASDAKAGVDDKIKAIKLMADINGWIKAEEKGTSLGEMPPSIHYAVGADHDKPPAENT